MNVNRTLNNHVVRLLAGNFGAGLLIVGIPTAIVMRMLRLWTPTLAGLLILAMVHVALIALQISHKGTWVPEKWLAAVFVFLPVIDVARTTSLYEKGLYLEGFWAFTMATVAAFFTVHVVKNQWQKWRQPKPVTVVTRVRPPRVSSTAHRAKDDCHPMLY